MPFTPSWTVENRVLWMELNGVVSPDERPALNA